MSRPLRAPSSRKGIITVAIATSFALTTLWETRVHADPAPPVEVEPVTPRVRLRHDPWLDGGVTVGLAAGTTVWALARPTVVSTSCGLCEAPGRVNGLDEFFRRTLRRHDVAPTITFSDVFGYGLAPLSAIGLTAAAAAVDQRGDEVLVDVLLVVEATTVDLAIDQVFLGAVRRERPDFHFASDDVRATETAQSVSSFPSGHVSAAFAMGASAFTVASMRGYRLAPMIGIMGALIGVTTGYFRIAGDRHYFTDVIGGAAIGTLTGVGIPLFFHSPERSERVGWLQHATISSSEVRGGRVVVLGAAF